MWTVGNVRLPPAPLATKVVDRLNAHRVIAAQGKYMGNFISLPLPLVVTVRRRRTLRDAPSSLHRALCGLRVRMVTLVDVPVWD